MQISLLVAFKLFYERGYSFAIFILYFSYFYLILTTKYLKAK